jgi:hypothetical protein
MSNALKFTTVINGIKKTAKTHFGTEYTVEKIDELGGWIAKVTVPRTRQGHGGTEVLNDLGKGVGYQAAIKLANDDYAANGGR